MLKTKHDADVQEHDADVQEHSLLKIMQMVNIDMKWTSFAQQLDLVYISTEIQAEVG